ncbi:MAG: hypothetical protein ACLGIN_12240 [Candidatus Sericytochromatia bacterium]
MTDKTMTGDTLAPNQDSRPTLKRCLRFIAEGAVSERRWRPRSQTGLAYYYHDQWKKADKAAVEKRGQAAITVNRVRITINMMLGLLAAQPVDPHAKPVGKNDDDLSDLGTAVAKHIWEENDGNGISLQSYFYQTAYSYAVAYTGFYVRDRDRRSEPVQALVLDPREVTRDPWCRRDDLTDCRWIDWRRKLPLETAQELYPEHKELLQRMVGEDTSGNGSSSAATHYEGPTDGTLPAPSTWDELSDWNLSRDVDQKAQMVTLHELWERRWEKGSLVFFRDGFVQELDPADPEQASLLFDPDVLRIEHDVDIPRIHYHVLCGNQLLVSKPSPYQHGQFPFVWVTNDLDHNNDPISEIEYLKDLQDEINHRRSKELWEMSNNQLLIDPNVLAEMGMTLDEAAAHAAKPGAVWMGQPGQVSYLQRGQIPGQQFRMGQDAKAEMQAVSGANDDLMGYDSSSTSAVSKDVSRQQGMTLQKPREGKFKGFLKRLIEQLMALVQQAWTEEKVIRLRDEVGRDRLIAVNRREVDPVTGMSRVINDIRAARFEYTMDFDAYTATTREKLGQVLKDLAGQEPDPIARRALLVAAIKALPIPDKAAIIDAYNEAAQASMPPAPPPVGDPGMMGGPPMDPAAMAMGPQAPVSPYAPQLAA